MGKTEAATERARKRTSPLPIVVVFACVAGDVADSR